MSVKNEGFLHLEFSMISSLNDSYRTIISVYGCDPNMSKEDANHFFQIISARYEKGSTILTSNLVFSQWAQIFGGDKVVTTAILDSVLHHSHVINIQGDSYRLKEKRESNINSDIYKFGAKSSTKIVEKVQVV